MTLLVLENQQVGLTANLILIFQEKGIFKIILDLILDIYNQVSLQLQLIEKY